MISRSAAEAEGRGSRTLVPDLVIRMKKGSDGTSSLSCARADGSATWQRNEGRKGRFFPVHDLTHYAVETVLGHRRGFFGLVVEGWDLDDFGSPWPRGPLPADMDPSEEIVGLLDVERGQGSRLDASTFRETYAASNPSRSAALATLSEEALDHVRGLRDELIARWDALPVGHTLELPFDRSR